MKEIAVIIGQFTQLNELVKKPEVAVDYRDLDYTNQLDFVPEMEQSLENVKELLAEAQTLILDQNTEF